MLFKCFYDYGYLGVYLVLLFFLGNNLAKKNGERCKYCSTLVNDKCICGCAFNCSIYLNLDTLIYVVLRCYVCSRTRYFGS